MIRFKRHGTPARTGLGTYWDSHCRGWRLFRESAKTKNGKPLRRWWRATKRTEYGYTERVEGPKGQARFRTRKAAVAACNRLAEQLRQNQLAFMRGSS